MQGEEPVSVQCTVHLCLQTWKKRDYNKQTKKILIVDNYDSYFWSVNSRLILTLIACTARILTQVRNKLKYV